jgi:ectoine hydroxylase-related dioxygenase (phytanoyl-CoA dioxygenase family)
MADHVAEYLERGYAVVRGVFSASEIATIGAAVDQIYAEGLAHGRSFRHGNLFYTVISGPDGRPHVPMVQWPSYHQAVLNAVRTDHRYLELLEPLIGRDLKQIINQLHWKLPHSRGDFAWHQDSRFRRPVEAYRNLGTSYVQTGLAIDPHNPATGGMRFIPGSHRQGPIGLDTTTEVLGNAPQDAALEAAGLSPDAQIDLVLEPGDIALWNPYLVHASGLNSSSHLRRLYINGYVRAEDCDRGEWAFRDGEPAPFGPEQALVHYEQLRERPEPHFV